jgi:hypothetical protein
VRKLSALLLLCLALAAPALATHTPATYTIGSPGGDYATIAAFLTAHPHGTGHTLTILPGTVTGQASTVTYLPPSTTIQGATSDRSLYVLTPSGVNNYVVGTDSLLTVQNVTFRSIANFTSYAVECEGNGAGAANVGNVTLRNVHIDDFTTTASQVIHGNDILRFYINGCYFDNCNAATAGAIYNNPFEPGCDLIVNNSIFYRNISTAYPCFSMALTDTTYTAADSVAFKNCLFVDNRKGSISISANFSDDVAVPHPSITLLADHCTFYGNETPGGTAAGKGQLVFQEASGFSTGLRVANCIFAGTDSTYALHSANIDSVVHTLAWGCGTALAGGVSNVIDGTAFADTLLGRNPEFNDTRVESGSFNITACRADVKGGCAGWECWPWACGYLAGSYFYDLGAPIRRR